jgi:hypothetical protein
MIDNKIMNRHIDFGSTTMSSYVPTQQQHIQTENSGIDANSALTMSNSHKIEIWYCYGWILTGN